MTLPTLLIATNNQHKVRELQQILSTVPVSLVMPEDTGIHVQVEETGRTYATNARRKALAFARASGLVSLADDSGLEVAALDGAPGIFSARYAGEGATSAQRIALLLRNLDGIPMAQRQARFVAVIAIARPDGQLRLARGSVRGVIGMSPHGEGGFGYDPVFYLPDYGCTMAELPDDVKNRISHRARAAQHAIPHILALCGAQ